MYQFSNSIQFGVYNTIFRMNFKILIVLIGIIVAVQSGTTSGGNLQYDCDCTRQYDPICGSDGETYDNWCLFGCVQEKVPDLKILRQGEC